MWLLALILGMGAAPVWGASDEDLLGLGFVAPPEVVTPARSPRPLSKIAENVTVINAEQIEALNAHTLAEVLNTIPGFRMERVRTPGSQNFFTIDGAPNAQIQVLIDGVPQNNVHDNTTELGNIPVQHIERIEIIKGAASAAWGSALSGVVNIITKSPASDTPATGAFTASIGERLTSDLRGEVSGKRNRLGYYLSGGYLHSDGLLPHNTVNFASVYAKLVYDLPGAGTLTLGTDYRNARAGIEEVPPPVDYRDSTAISYNYYFLNLSRPLADHLHLEVLAHLFRDNNETLFGSMSTPAPFEDFHDWTTTRGGSAKLVWGERDLNLVTGVDYEHIDETSSEPFQNNPLANFKRTIDRFGYYANGTITLGGLTLLPGARLDQTGPNGDLASYTMGGTYKLTEQTLVRGYWARGYSLPKTVFLEHGPQRVWTVQGGIETSQIPFLWFKGTFFYNDTWNIEADDGSGTLSEQIRKGGEVEVRTIPFFNTSLGAGYTYTDLHDRDTGKAVPGAPKQVAKLSVHYDNKRLGLSGVLTGDLVKWNANDGIVTKDDAVVWDLTLTKKLARGDLAPELFFTGHNLFNSPQFVDDRYRNARRWLEGGVRCRF